MGLTLSQAQAWRPETIQAIAVGLKQALGVLGETLDTAQTDTNKAAGASGGTGEEARFDFTDRATAHGRLKHGQITQLRQAVDEAGYGLIAKRGHLATTVEEAARDGMKVWNNGTVTGYDEAKIKKHAQAIGAALSELEQADQEYGQKIDSITALIKDEPKGRRTLGVIGGAKDAPFDPNKAAHDQAKAIADGTMDLPTDPKQLHDMWEQLSPQEKDAIYNTHHDIGNYDGISCVDRDHYNRLNLDQIGGHVADVVRGQLYGERMLLYVDPQGHVAIATRNPDTAKNVCAFVPGAGTSLDGTPVFGMGLASGIQLCDDIQHAADLADGKKDTAVVYWDNYDAPNLLNAGTSSANAEAAAPKFDSFMDGLHVSHDNSSGPGHYTAEGWSYGSTVIGEAASHGRSLAVDDVIFVGSPGVDVQNVADLHMTGHDPNAWNHTHVHSTVDQGDPLVGPLAVPLPQIEGHVHGPNPTDKSAFGDNDVFDTTPHVTVLSDPPATVEVPGFNLPGMDGDIPVLPPVSFPIPGSGGTHLAPDPNAHTDYWDSFDNPGFKRQASIITGE